MFIYVSDMKFACLFNFAWGIGINGTLHVLGSYGLNRSIPQLKTMQRKSIHHIT